MSLPVPTPRFADEAAGVLAYPLIPGRPLIGRDAPQGGARRLGEFLRELHAIDLGTVAGLVPTEDAGPSAWLEDLGGPPPLLSLLHATIPPPARRHVVAHADLGAEHILEQNGALSGVIDWSDAAITDPALDFAGSTGTSGRTSLPRHFTPTGGLDDTDETMARIEFFARCVALEDLAYGRESGRKEYTRSAERSLGWLFANTR